MDLPFVVILALVAVAVGVSVFGLRGALELRMALRLGELDRLDAPSLWHATRAFCGLAFSIPVLASTAPLGGGAWLAAASVATLGYCAMPRFLASARARVEREVLDDLPLHLDLMALSVERGVSLGSAFSFCAEHAPEGTLRRALGRVILDVHQGMEPLEALRGLEQRLRLRPLGTLVLALRTAERLGMPPAQVLREKARQSAANRFAHAERRARAAPLKLWATLVLCFVPCTCVVLAYPVARILAQALGG
jgi:pilus assembly protein TadC